MFSFSSFGILLILKIDLPSVMIIFPYRNNFKSKQIFENWSSQVSKGSPWEISHLSGIQHYISKDVFYGYSGLFKYHITVQLSNMIFNSYKFAVQHSLLSQNNILAFIFSAWTNHVWKILSLTPAFYQMQTENIFQKL